MHRRNFLKVSGASLAGLLITEFADAGKKKTEVIQLPDAIEIQAGDEYYSLRSADQRTWHYRDVTVSLKTLNGKISIGVQSPSLRLKEVRLSWLHSTAAASKILGDHWERTYGDVRWETIKPSKKLPWYCAAYDGNNTVCFGVRTGCRTICYWQMSTDKLQLTLDTRTGGNGVALHDRILHAADIVTTKNEANENVFATLRRFCSQMCDAPKRTARPVYGINDWYFAYGNNSAGLILDHTALLSALATDTNNRPFSVIDAGWAVKSPLMKDDCCWSDDFSRSNEKFGDMQKLAGEIKNLGMRPGLWVRPLSASHDENKNLLMPSIPGRDNPRTPFLDPTIEENLQRIKNLLQTYDRWGFELVKHDYTTYDIFGRWGFQMADSLTSPRWQFYDDTKTNAEIILQLYSVIREAAGQMYLIGCNTLSHLSAGIFELNRTGDDTSGKDWERTRKMGVNTLGFRMVQHKTFYEADGDCVGLTKEVPWSSNRQWMQLLAQSSTPLFISAERDQVGREQKQIIRECFSAAASEQPVGEPLDWLTNAWPSRWKLDGKEVDFDWS